MTYRPGEAYRYRGTYRCRERANWCRGGLPAPRDVKGAKETYRFWEKLTSTGRLFVAGRELIGAENAYQCRECL